MLFSLFAWKTFCCFSKYVFVGLVDYENCSIEVDAGVSGVQSQTQIHNKLKISQGSMSPYLKQNKTQQKPKWPPSTVAFDVVASLFSGE